VIARQSAPSRLTARASVESGFNCAFKADAAGAGAKCETCSGYKEHDDFLPENAQCSGFFRKGRPLFLSETASSKTLRYQTSNHVLDSQVRTLIGAEVKDSDEGANPR